MTIAVLYALCVLTPSAAAAFGIGDQPAHCFTEQQLGLHVHQAAAGHARGGARAHEHAHMQAHVHNDSAAHRHADSHHPGTRDRDNDPAACCGLFGVTAMAVDPQVDLGAPSRHSAILPASFEELSGRGPDRINRPPIALLPL